MTDTRDRNAKLLSLAVHELRTPVSVAAGSVRMLLRHFGEGLGPEQRKLLQQNERSCGRLADLISELNDVANLEGGRMRLTSERIDVGPMLAGLAAAREGAEPACTLTVEMPSPPVHVVGDAARLASALAAFVAAAARERADPTRLVLDCRLEDRAGTRLVRIAIGEPGLAEAISGGALEADGTFDEFRGGLGLRLVLASRIVAAHHGHVSSPVADRGKLAIVVTLPAAPADDAGAAFAS